MADADEQALMESLLECTGWTNTPSKARLRHSRDLYNLIPEGGESRGEAAYFATCVQNARFGNVAGEEFQTFTNRDSDILAPHLMADVAAEGDSSDAIGLAVSDGISEATIHVSAAFIGTPNGWGSNPCWEC